MQHRTNPSAKIDESEPSRTTRDESDESRHLM
jgi:hypothetical protein